jgi:uncharacterized protein
MNEHTLSKPLTVHIHSQISDIAEADWDACAGSDNPFIRYSFFHALEQSGSAGQRTGWLPRHMVVRDAQQQIAAIIPLYIKTNSFGEYIFDQPWAEALERAGGQYYPKLQCAVPFSPVPGTRILRHPHNHVSYAQISQALIAFSRECGVSSTHITFCSEHDISALKSEGWMERLGVQFHWKNQAYKNFDDFLAALTSGHRKTIKRERRDVHNSGIELQTLRGNQITEQHWNAFYSFYIATTEQKWGNTYLTRDFFTLLAKAQGDAVILMLARDGGAYIAGALHLVGAHTLYGRNWGCIKEVPFLHFELCYYRAIDFAIEHGLQTIEAGAQGIHKIQRGYLPELTYSAHWIAHNGLSKAIDGFLNHERIAIHSEVTLLAQRSPFKKI